MRDEMDCRIWNAHHETNDSAIARIGDDCARSLEAAHEALLRRVREVGFRSAIMIAALAVSGTSILLTVTPAGAA